ncbi:hypothetical protein AMTR_s00021p00203530 [Amborella trichopoda]|uniref:Uncharacterized protein n=1 Tax=Amborella trichopoda TaxID=13333 RepID=W1Q0P6_AMBTC|nr:hypothetical protein AMTR_s00021p00203530 [Amborella trichopoda]
MVIGIEIAPDPELVSGPWDRGKKKALHGPRSQIGRIEILKFKNHGGARSPSSKRMIGIPKQN